MCPAPALKGESPPNSTRCVSHAGGGLASLTRRGARCEPLGASSGGVPGAQLSPVGASSPPRPYPRPHSCSLVPRSRCRHAPSKPQDPWNPGSIQTQTPHQCGLLPTPAPHTVMPSLLLVASQPEPMSSAHLLPSWGGLLSQQHPGSCWGSPVLTGVTRMGVSMKPQGCAHTTSGHQHTGGHADGAPGVHRGPSHLGRFRHGAACSRVWPVRRSHGTAGAELSIGPCGQQLLVCEPSLFPRLRCPSWRSSWASGGPAGFCCWEAQSPALQQVPAQGSEARAAPLG